MNNIYITTYILIKFYMSILLSKNYHTPSKFRLLIMYKITHEIITNLLFLGSLQKNFFVILNSTTILLG